MVTPTVHTGPTGQTGVINVTERLAEGRFSKFHFWMLFFACLVVAFDMYDLAIYGSVLPLLLTEWGISAATAGAIGSAGLFGMMLGAMSFGILADRLGRRKMLITAIIVFSGATTLCAFAPSPALFAVLRFVAGFGIGGIFPTSMAMVSDYAPKRIVSTLIAIITCAISVGGILAALVAMTVIPNWGWRATYIIAAVPLFLLPIMQRYFADSPSALLHTGRQDKLRSILNAIKPGSVSTQSQLVVEEQVDPADQAATGGNPIKTLFANRRGLATLFIWIAFFMCLLMINGLNTWLPQLMVSSGFALNAGLLSMAVLNAGAIVGTLTLGRVSDKIGVKKVIVPMFALAGVVLILFGMGWPVEVLIVLAFFAGGFAMGAQNLSYAFVAKYYPAHIRSTGIGMASAVGRLGAIGGPFFGGLLISAGATEQTSFLFYAVPGFIAAVAFALVPLGVKKEAKV